MSCCYGNGPPEIKAVVTDGLYSESIGGAVVNINSNAKTKEKNGQKKKKKESFGGYHGSCCFASISCYHFSEVGDSKVIKGLLG